MEHTSSASIKSARWLLAVLFAVNVYRAATQSITTDEAFTYNDFVAPALTEMFARYDANNHVLNTLLIKLSVALFGLNEFAVRLPSVVAGGFYLAVVYRMCRRLFDRGPLFLAAVALLSLNPLLLDYLSAARGYGMAVALWMAAVLVLLESAENYFPYGVYWAGICLALAVAANLTLLVPAIALGLVFSAFALSARRTNVWDLVEQLVLPGVVLDFVLLLLPMSRLDASHFYYGAATLRDAIDSIAKMSLFHYGYRPALFGIAVDRDRTYAILAPFLLALAGLVAVMAFWVLRRASIALRLVAGTMLVSLSMLVAARHLLGTLYPLTRTGLYWIPLFSLTGLLLADHLESAALRTVALAIAAVVTLQYASQFEVTFYGEWPDEAQMRKLARILCNDAGGRSVRMAASWPAHVTLEFYRHRFDMTTSPPVEPAGTAVQSDYYILERKDWPLVGKLGLRVLAERDRLVLARR